MSAVLYTENTSVNYISKQLPVGNFTQVSSDLLSPLKSGLSPKASHLLSFLVSKYKSWMVHVKQLMHELKKGSHYIRTALKELQEKGFIYRQRCIDKQGRFVGMRTWVRQTPNAVDSADGPSFHPRCDFPHSDYPRSENLNVYKQGDQKEGALKIKQQQGLPSSPPLPHLTEQELDGKLFESSLVYNCEPTAAFFEIAEEVSNMVSNVQADIGYHVSEPRHVLVDAEERRNAINAIKDEARATALEASSKLNGVVPVRDLMAYLKKYGQERVDSALKLVLKRDIFSKNNPGAYFATALRSAWSTDDAASRVEKAEDKMIENFKKLQGNFTKEENSVWWNGLNNEEKLDQYAVAMWKCFQLPSYFKQHGISVLDSDFATNPSKAWLFSMVMEVLGRQQSRDISV